MLSVWFSRFFYFCCKNGENYYSFKINILWIWSPVIAYSTRRPAGGEATVSSGVSRWRMQMATVGKRTSGCLWGIPAPLRTRRRQPRRPHTPRKRCRWRRMASTAQPSTLRVLQTPKPPSRCMQGVPGAGGLAGPDPGGIIRSASALTPSANGKNAWAEAVPPQRNSPRWHNATV